MIQEEKNTIKLYSKVFICIVLIGLSIYFNKWWLWLILFLNTISDFSFLLGKYKKDEKVI